LYGYVNSSFTLVPDVPSGVVTVTSTVLPIEFVMVGEVAVIDVSETTWTPVAATLPKSTAVAPVKLTPVIVTAVPPGVVVEAVDDVTLGATEGLTPVTTGAADAAPAGDAARNPSAGAIRATAASAPTVARNLMMSFRQNDLARPLVGGPCHIGFHILPGIGPYVISGTFGRIFPSKSQ
jgi:hypothetical protein